MKTLIEIKNLSVIYDTEEDGLGAINDVSLDIYENDFVCILGPSGCGKSTLLKTIAGFIRPNKGQVLMNGEPIDGPSDNRGIVFQEPTLFPWFTVKDNIAIGPKFNKKDPDSIETIVDDYLAQVSLSEYKDAKVFELSGGQQQRVAIARTLANHPDVILMDEPFGALDSLTREKMQRMIRTLWKKNHTTVFFVTHDIDEALLLGTKIHVMRKERQSVVKSFDVDYTRRLLENPDEPVMNEAGFLHLKQSIHDLLEE
ncbi:MAG: ABC transporter ATP-binding protein [Bacillota bacterium]